MATQTKRPSVKDIEARRFKWRMRFGGAMVTACLLAAGWLDGTTVF